MVIQGLGSTIFNVLVSGINAFISLIFSPIIQGVDNLITTFFGNVLLSPVIDNFYEVLNNYVIYYLGYFSSLIPPLTWDVIILSLDLFILVHAFNITYGLIFKAFKLIKEFVPLA